MQKPKFGNRDYVLAVGDFVADFLGAVPGSVHFLYGVEI